MNINWCLDKYRGALGTVSDVGLFVPESWGEVNSEGLRVRSVVGKSFDPWIFARKLRCLVYVADYGVYNYYYFFYISTDSQI